MAVYELVLSEGITVVALGWVPSIDRCAEALGETFECDSGSKGCWWVALGRCITTKGR